MGERRNNGSSTNMKERNDKPCIIRIINSARNHVEYFIASFF